MKPWMLLIMLISSVAMTQAETYKWVDADGKVHYSDQPPPPERQEKRAQAIRRQARGGPDCPIVLQQADEEFPCDDFRV